MSDILEKPEHIELERSDSPSFDRKNDMDMTICDDCEHLTRYPNKWSKIREVLREPVAEFLGVMILVIFGTGADCQVFLSANPKVAALARGDFLSLNFGWSVGVALGVWVSGGVSGGHINPAVTLALATFRDFPWKKVPTYILAQCLGGFCGGAIVYANYFHAIDVYEGPGVRTIAGSGDLLATYAADYMSPVSCFFSEFLGSALLMLGVLCITDKKNGPPPPGLAPLALFIIVLGLGTSLGMETSYALNPARDLGPRIFTAMAGYGSDVFTYRNQYWLWCPILAPILGMQAAALIYDGFIFTGSESIINKPDARAARKHLHACPQQRNKIPAGVDNA